MGNNPVSGVDPDGRYEWKIVAEFFNVLFWGNGVSYNSKLDEYYFTKGSTLKNGDILIQAIYKTPLYLSANLRFDYGVQGGFDFRALGGKISVSGEYRTKPIAELGFNYKPSNPRGERFKTTIYDPCLPAYLNDKNVNTSLSFAGLIGRTLEYGYSNEKLLGILTSQTTHIPFIGKHSVHSNFLGKKTETRHSWDFGEALSAGVGAKLNIEFGFILNH